MKNTFLPRRFVFLMPFLACSYVAVSQSVDNLNAQPPKNNSPTIDLPDKGVPMAINALPVASNTYFNYGKITSTGKIMADANVTFKSTYAIQLKTGFSAEIGATFKAIIGNPDEDPTIIANKKRQELAIANQSHFTYRIFPNPVSESFNLEISADKEGAAEITVVNVLGAVLLTKSLTVNKGIQQLPINCSDWTSGLYLVRIKINDSIKSEHIVVNNR